MKKLRQKVILFAVVPLLLALCAISLTVFHQVVGLPRWGWMLGTGVYLDDIDAVLAEADKKASNNITSTMLWILVITVLTLLVIIALGLALNIWEQRDARLR